MIFPSVRAQQKERSSRGQLFDPLIDPDRPHRPSNYKTIVQAMGVLKPFALNSFFPRCECAHQFPVKPFTRSAI